MEVGASFQASGLTPMPRARRFTPCMFGERACHDPVYQKGVQWLLRNQLADGSWFAPTRAVPVQPHTFRASPTAASICLGCCFVLGNDVITLYTAGQASLEAADFV